MCSCGIESSIVCPACFLNSRPRSLNSLRPLSSAGIILLQDSYNWFDLLLYVQEVGWRLYVPPPYPLFPCSVPMLPSVSLKRTDFLVFSCFHVLTFPCFRNPMFSPGHPQENKRAGAGGARRSRSRAGPGRLLRRALPGKGARGLPGGVPRRLPGGVPRGIPRGLPGLQRVLNFGA